MVSEKARKLLDTIEKWVDEECIPADAVYSAQMGIGDERWEGHPSILDDLKKRARQLGLWNMFLPKNHYSNLAEYDTDRKSTRLNSSHSGESRMPSSA